MYIPIEKNQENLLCDGLVIDCSSRAFPGLYCKVKEIISVGIASTTANHHPKEGWLKICGYKFSKLSGMACYEVKADKYQQCSWHELLKLNPYWFKDLTP